MSMLHQVPQPRTCHDSGRNTSATIRQRLELGARVTDWFYLQSDSGGESGTWRWRELIEEHLKLTYTDATRKRVMRCYTEFITHSGAGRNTALASGGVTPTSNSTIEARARQRRPCIRHRKMAPANAIL